EEGESGRGMRGEDRRLSFFDLTPRNHPVGIFAHKESNRRDAGRHNTTFSVRRRLERSRMRRQATPADSTGEAKMVEHAGIKIGDAALEDLAFPGDRRRLEPLHLTD